MSNPCNKFKIAAYTRNSSPAYSIYLAQSVHFAVSCDGGKSYTPLFMNYGMLFPECHFDENNGIVSAGVVNVSMSKTGDVYTIYGDELVRHQIKDGIFMKSCESEMTGKVIKWITKDFKDFSWPEVCEKSCKCEDESGRGCKAEALDGACGLDICENDAVAVEIPEKLAVTLLQDNRQIEFKEVLLPTDVSASDAAELEDISAKVLYTDGSTHVKKVDWDLGGVDFGKSGKYTVKGKIRCRKFPFPVEQRPWGDPIITYYNGKYYFIGTDDAQGQKKFEVRQAQTPEALFDENVKRSTILAYTEGKYESTFWAPEFHIANGRMCLFCTIGKGGFDPQSHVMMLKEGGDMLNPDDWSEPHRCVMPDGRFLGINPLGDNKNGITLDMTYFEVKGRGFVVWSFRTWAGTDSGSMLMFAEVDVNKPWQLITFPQLFSRPRFGWENINGTDNNEGPHPIVTKDKVYVAYSGGDAAGDTYVLGAMVADTCAELTDMSVWKKSLKPVLASDFVAGELGCGHNGFFVDEFGDTFITYHGHKTLGVSDRIDGIRRVHFGADGMPYLYMSAEQDIPESEREVKITLTVK